MSGADGTGAPPSRRRARWLRHAALVPVLGLLLALAGVFTAAPAQALPALPDCTAAPTPEVPGRGTVGFFEGPPATPPAPVNPFTDPDVSVHDQYGYAGLQWYTYDLGCGPEVARAPDATIGTAVANWAYTLPKTLVAATGALLGAAYEPDFLQVFDTLTLRVVDALNATVFQQWAGLVVAAIGVLLLWRSRRAHLSSSAAAVGWALLVMVLATAVFRWPLLAGEAADRAVTATMSSVTGALNEQTGRTDTGPGGQISATLHEALLYQPWLGGQFGDSSGTVARTYGPQVFDAQAMTWAQARTLQDDPVAGQRIVEAKQAAFAQAAEQVKGRDPDAYEYFVGRRSDARVGYALLSTVAVLCAVPFLLASAFLVLGALIIIRFGVMLFPAIATLGMFPTMRGLVVGLGNTMAAALINALVFGIGTAVTVRGIGVIMDPANGLAPWLVVVMVLLLTVVMWFALRPFRRLTLMVTPGGDHFGTAVGGFGGVAQGARRAAGRIVTTAAGVFAGTSASAAARDDDTATAGSPSAAPQRAEADIGPPTTSGVTGPRAGPAAGTGTTAGTPGTDAGGAAVGAAAVAASRPLTALGPAPSRTEGGAARDDPAAQEERVPAEARTGTAGWSPSPSPGGELPAPIEPAEIDGEEVFVLYRPDRSTGDGVRADA